MITASTLRAVMRCSLERATVFVEPLALTMDRYQINTRLRQAAFLAQIGHESGGLKYVREIWGPTIAQQRYEGRKDLGNTQPGDGRRFLGRGLIQLTGRANYARMSAVLGLDFVSTPEALESPLYASLSAGEFWSSRKLNALADVGDMRLITRRINGGYNGLEDRLARYDTALQELT